MATDSSGFLYVATGDHLVAEMKRSAQTVKREHDYPITLITDRNVRSPHIDDVVVVDDPRYDSGDKVFHMSEFPYDRTVFVDTDTYVDGDVVDLFEILSEFDIAAAHAPNRVNVELDSVPRSLPEYNTGVIAYRDCAAVRELFSTWERTYREHARAGVSFDQPSFRSALYESDVRVATLPTEFNCLFMDAGHLDGTARVLHGRHYDMDYVTEKLNDGAEQRVFVRDGRKLRVYERGEEPGLLLEFLRSLELRGVRETAVRGVKRLLG